MGLCVTGLCVCVCVCWCVRQAFGSWQGPRICPPPTHAPTHEGGHQLGEDGRGGPPALKHVTTHNGIDLRLRDHLRDLPKKVSQVTFAQLNAISDMMHVSLESCQVVRAFSNSPNKPTNQSSQPASQPLTHPATPGHTPGFLLVATEGRKLLCVTRRLRPAVVTNTVFAPVA